MVKRAFTGQSKRPGVWFWSKSFNSGRYKYGSHFNFVWEHRWPKLSITFAGKYC